MLTAFEQIIQEAYNSIASAGVTLLYAIIVLIVGLWLIKMSGKWIKNSRLVSRMDPAVASFFMSFIRILLYVLLILCLVEILELPTAGFITVLASCSVAVGMSLQGALSNFAGALILLFFKPFKVGDYIEANGYSGTVTAITVFYTTLRTVDNHQVILPNGTLTAAALVNYSAEKYRRVDLEYLVAYTTSVDEVKKVILGVIQADPLAIIDGSAPEAPFVRVSKQDNNSITYLVKVWCNSADYWDLYYNLNDNIVKAFEENKIAIPYNQVMVQEIKK